MTSTPLSNLLELSAARHNHLCPRQVLGVRVGLAGTAALNLETPRKDKRLLVILETDGCFADGIEVATGCTVGHRTLRVEDYGKIAATFVNVASGSAVRLHPRPEIRERSFRYAEDEKRQYFAQLQAYQVMPDSELLTIQTVSLSAQVEQIISRPGVRVNCMECGEEIINEREVTLEEVVLCRGCARPAYYNVITEPEQVPLWPAYSHIKNSI